MYVCMYVGLRRVWHWPCLSQVLFKSHDIGQMLIVADPDSSAAHPLDPTAATAEPLPSGTAYHSGLTPPAHRVLERRFHKENNFHVDAAKFPPEEVAGLARWMKPMRNGEVQRQTYDELVECVWDTDTWDLLDEAQGGGRKMVVHHEESIMQGGGALLAGHGRRSPVPSTAQSEAISPLDGSTPAVVSSNGASALNTPYDGGIGGLVDMGSHPGSALPSRATSPADILGGSVLGAIGEDIGGGIVRITPIEDLGGIGGAGDAGNAGSAGDMDILSSLLLDGDNDFGIGDDSAKEQSAEAEAAAKARRRAEQAAAVVAIERKVEELRKKRDATNNDTLRKRYDRSIAKEVSAFLS